MSPNQYQAFVSEVAIYEDTIYPVLGLAEEAGEVASLFSKMVRDKTERDRLWLTQLKKELGDCLWMVAAIARDNNITLQEVIDANVEKLQSRRKRGVLGGSG